MKVSINNDDAIYDSSLPFNLELSKSSKRDGNNRNEKDKPSPYDLLYKSSINSNSNSKISIMNEVLLEQNSCVKEINVYNDSNISTMNTSITKMD